MILRNLTKQIFKVHLVSEHIYCFIIMTVKMNKNVREAFDAVINRKEIAKNVSKIMPNPLLAHLMTD